MRIALALALLSATALAQDLTLENDALRLTLSPKGAVTSIFDKVGGKEYGVEYPIASATKGGKRTSCRKLALEDGVLDLTFGSFGIKARVAVEKHPKHFVFQLKQVQGEPDSITFFQVRTIALQRVTWGGILWFEDYCIGLCEGEPETQLSYGSGKNGRLHATAHADPGIKANRVALYGCPKAEVRATVAALERAFGIPLDAETKANAANRRSYLMCSVGAKDVDRLVDYAKRGGFGSILMVVNSWASYGNKYRVPKSRWPGGLPQLKAAVDKLHAAGLLAGAHMFASKVPKRSEYTSPIPDKRIYKDHFATLAQDLDAKADRIVTTEPPAGWPRLPGTRDIHIDDELITYTSLSLEPPYGFVGCRRGAYGTTPAAHKAGANMGRPVTDESRGIFIIDQRTDLLDEVAANIARTYDAAGFDWMYFDGAEDVPPPRWYTTTMAQLKTIQRVKRKPVIVQDAAAGPFCWHLVTRRGQRDYFWISMDSKDEVDDAITRTVPRVKAALMAVDIGWFQWRNPTRENPRTQIDEFEYLYTKALAADVAVSVQASADRIEAHPQRDAILYIIGKLEQLRIDNYFSDEVKKRVRTPHTDFMLVTDDKGKYHLQRAREIPFVAGTSRQVRAMIAERIGKVTTISIWNVLGKCYLDVGLLPDKCTFTDYAGKPIKVQVLPGSIIRIPVTTRLYLKTTHHRGLLRMAFRRARVTPILPDMVVAQAEDANTIHGHFTTGSKVGLQYGQVMGDCVVPSASFTNMKPAETDYLEFTVDIPKAGTWKLWAHVRHEDTSSNSFYIAAPADAQQERFLNDYNFGFWHWAAGKHYKLPKGPFTFRIYAREARKDLSPALDMVVLVNDVTYVPAYQDVKKAARKGK